MKKHWTYIIENKKYIDSIYNEETIDLYNSTIMWTSISYTLNRIDICIDLPKYPFNPPEKWKKKSANTAQLTLGIMDIEKVSISGWQNNGEICDVDIMEMTHNTKLVKIDGVNVKIVIHCNNIFISNITSYLK